MEPVHYDLFGINLYESKRMEKSIPKKHLKAFFKYKNKEATRKWRLKRKLAYNS